MTVNEALERAIRILCERSGLDLQEGVKGVMETLDANGFVVVPREPTPDMIYALNGCGGATDEIWPAMIEAALSHPR